MLSTPQMQGIIQRLMTIGDNSTGELSSGMRLVRGFVIYAGLPVVNQLLGTGLGQLEGAIPYYGLTTAYDISGSVEYMNTLAYLLNSVGLLGFLFFIAVLLSYCSRNSMSGRLLLLFIVMMVSGYIYSTPIFLLILAFISSGKRLPEKQEIHREITPCATAAR